MSRQSHAQVGLLAEDGEFTEWSEARNSIQELTDCLAAPVVNSVSAATSIRLVAQAPKDNLLKMLFQSFDS